MNFLANPDIAPKNHLEGRRSSYLTIVRFSFFNSGPSNRPHVSDQDNQADENYLII